LLLFCNWEPHISFSSQPGRILYPTTAFEALRKHLLFPSLRSLYFIFKKPESFRIFVLDADYQLVRLGSARIGREPMDAIIARKIINNRWKMGRDPELNSGALEWLTGHLCGAGA
jgi:hypothetical protein